MSIWIPQFDCDDQLLKQVPDLLEAQGFTVTRLAESLDQDRQKAAKVLGLPPVSEIDASRFRISCANEDAVVQVILKDSEPPNPAIVEILANWRKEANSPESKLIGRIRELLLEKGAIERLPDTGCGKKRGRSSLRGTMRSMVEAWLVTTGIFAAAVAAIILMHYRHASMLLSIILVAVAVPACAMTGERLFRFFDARGKVRGDND